MSTLADFSCVLSADLLLPSPSDRMEDDLLAGAVSPEAAAAAVVASPFASTSSEVPQASTSVPTSASSAPGVVWGRGAPASGQEGEVGTPLPVEGKASPSKELMLLLEVVDRLEGTGGTA